MSQVIYYDWSAGSDNRLRATSDGHAFGRTLGTLLSQHSSLKEITLIGQVQGLL